MWRTDHTPRWVAVASIPLADGPEGHAALLKKLGGEPSAPKSLSGSGKPDRYHLFFRHPDGI